MDNGLSHDSRYMVVPSDSDGQLHQFESVHVGGQPAPQSQAPMQQRQGTQDSPQQQHLPSSLSEHQQYIQQQHNQIVQPRSTPHSRQQSGRSIRTRADSTSAHSHRSNSHNGINSAGPSRDPSTRRPRIRTDTAASSTPSDGSLNSESEFIAYRDDPHLLHQPLPTPHYLQGQGQGQGQDRQQQQQQQQQIAQMMIGRQYGPYSYLNDPHNMAAERHYLANSTANNPTFYNSSQESVNNANKMYSTPSSRSNSSQGGNHSYQYYPYPSQQYLQQQPYSNSRAPLMHPSSSGSSSGSSSKIPAGFSNNTYTPRQNVRAVGAGGGVMTAASTAPSSTLGHDSVDMINQTNYTANHASETHFLYDAKNPEQDDYMHNPSQHDAIMEKRTCTMMSIRGFFNVATLVLIILALVGMFGAYPVILEIYDRTGGPLAAAYGPGGTNSSGQVPDIPGLPGLIDKKTPKSHYTRTGFDGQKYSLVFSDEFETDGRSFWPGDDPYWEAVDLHYWGTGDYEWYDPDAVTTKDGHLEITITQEQFKDLNYRSGMLQSWNKLCFTGGFIEVSVSLPGTSQISGFWPGVWTMGNLARAGYGATTEGVWPYSYDSCDVGTLKNQTTATGEPAAAAALSMQPGQRLSACTCKGEDHPGPNVRTGRGAPEIDIIEAQISSVGGKLQGEVSQSAQIAPYDDKYMWIQTSPATTIYDSDLTTINSYVGGPYQEAVSAVTLLHDDGYEVNGGFRTYGIEYQPGSDDDAFITWMYDDKPTWKVTPASFPADAVTQVSQRLVSEEPMSININFAMSASFQTVDLANLPFPAKMRVDYVRVYQREGMVKLTCDPDDYPTAKYINDHLPAYSNANYTTWDLAGYEFPKNSLVDKC